MKWLPRRVFDGTTLISLLLCLTAAAIWVRGYFVADEIYDDDGRRTIVAWSSKGGVLLLRSRLAWNNPMATDAAPPRWAVRNYEPEDLLAFAAALAKGAATHRFAGFCWRSDDDPSGLTSWLLFPLWSIVLLAAVLPAIWTIRRLKRRGRHAAGCCPVCGYDLRASPDRCPECGAIPPRELTRIA